MADLHYLIEREREQELRTSARVLIFADGKTHCFTSYRLVWRWYDRLCACDYTFDEDEIIAMIPRCADHENLSLDDALPRVLGVLLARLDRDGIDPVDDNLQLTIAREQMAKWKARKDGSTGMAN